MGTRVKFDFEVTFKNGGGIQGQDFRLDSRSDDITDEQLLAYIIQDLRLLRVDACTILRKEIIEDANRKDFAEDKLHKGTLLIDVSHVVEHGMITYKGLPAPIICDFLSREASKEIYEEGTSFQIGRIDMVSNTGTYLDTPFHRFEGGKDLSELDLARLANLDGVVIPVGTGEREITPENFSGVEVRGRAVLIRTDWSDHWATDHYFEDFPFLNQAAAEYLRDNGAKLVGIDSHNIDDTRGASRPVHTTLLGADIPIVEHMTHLRNLPETGFKFFAVPVKVKGMGTFPVRAFGLV